MGIDGVCRVGSGESVEIGGFVERSFGGLRCVEWGCYTSKSNGRNWKIWKIPPTTDKKVNFRVGGNFIKS